MNSPHPPAPPPVSQRPLRDAPLAERVRWCALMGAIFGVALAVVALLYSDVRRAGFAHADVLTPAGAVSLLGTLGFSLGLPLVGAWVGLLLPLARTPWRGAAVGALGALPIIAVLAVGVPWAAPAEAATNLGPLLGTAMTTGAVLTIGAESTLPLASRRGRR